MSTIDEGKFTSQRPTSLPLSYAATIIIIIIIIQSSIIMEYVA